MEIREEKSGDTVTYHLKGRFTYSDHTSFRGILAAIGTSGTRRIVFDFAPLEFIDSAGMGMLLLVNDTARKAGVSLVLKGATGQVERLFAGQKFAALFTLEK